MLELKPTFKINFAYIKHAVILKLAGQNTGKGNILVCLQFGKLSPNNIFQGDTPSTNILKETNIEMADPCRALKV